MARLFAFLAVLAALIGLLVFRAARNGRAEGQPADPIDSVVPRPVAIARFREGLPQVDSLAGGERSRDALVRRFTDALRAHDTATIRGLVLTKAEYAWLYYETTPQGLPPYDLAPELLWFLIEGRSSQGLSHLMEARAGRGFQYAGFACDSSVSIEGANRLHGPCSIHRVRETGDTVTERLFGPIIERGGRFKFLSLSNRL